MVRNIVGALVEIGSARLSAQGLEDLLVVADRRRAPPTFSAAGLYFEGPTYDDGFSLPNYSGGGTAD